MELSLLKPNPNNPRTISEEQMNKLKLSVEKLPKMMPLRPIIYDENFIVIGGNMRLRALLALGKTDVPDDWAKQVLDFTEEEKREFVIKDNVGFGNWDMSELANQYTVEELTEWGMADVMFPEPEEIEGETDPDDVPSTPEVPKTVKGDLYELGDHRLLCGDSTILADVEKLANGEQVDCFVTDPPYNVNYEGGDGAKIKNDKMSGGEFIKFLTDAFSNAGIITKAGGCVYIFHAESEGINFRIAMRDGGFGQKQTIIWVKNAPVMGRQDYNWQHEPILYGWKPGAAHYFCGDFTQKTIVDDDVDLKKLGKPELISIINKFRNGEQISVIRESKPHKNDQHPTMKPVELVGLLIENSSRKGEIVLDLFLGSSSTMVACHRLGRKCYGMELDEKYCDVGVKRMLQFDPSLELKKNGVVIDKAEWL